MQRKHFIPALLCCGAILASCTDVWEEHYQPNPELNAEETLWDLIKDDPELDQFEKFLVATNYDSLLMKDRFYTVWAPVNGFEYNEANREVWENEFVQNHIANYSHVAGGKVAEEHFVTMLNGKYIHFENSKGKFTFKGLPLKAQNKAAKNGILHKINGYADFVPNIWEQLAKEENVDSLYQFLLKDYKREFDPYNSVEGPTVEGKVTYLDSVFTESNPWFYTLGELNREDSAYTMFALTNGAWQSMKDLASTYFEYPTGTEGNNHPGDSVRDVIVRELICKNLVFSDKVNAKYRNGNGYDTLVSNYRLFYGNREPLIFGGEEVTALYNGVTESTTRHLSNGTLHIVDQVNYDPLKCWHDTIRLEAEYLAGKNSSDQAYADRGFDSEQCKMTTTVIDEDSVNLYNRISAGAVAAFSHNANADAGVELAFGVTNVLSANYRIKVVVLPPQVINPADTFLIKPSVFTARIQFATDEPNISSSPFKLVDAETLSDTIKTDPTDIDTIVLCLADDPGIDYVKVPVCEFESASRFKDVKTQTKLYINSHVLGTSGTAKDNYIYAKDNVVRKEIELRALLADSLVLAEALLVATEEVLVAEADFEAAMATKDRELILECQAVLQACQKKKGECETAFQTWESDVKGVKAEIEEYSQTLSAGLDKVTCDNVLRIDQVIFEPVE